MPSRCSIHFPLKGAFLTLRVDREILGEIISPRPVTSPGNATKEVVKALTSPVGTPPLSQMARPGHKVAIILDDITRPTPTHLLLPPVLKELHSAGVHRADICLVIALGTHRPMTKEEILGKVGPDVADKYTIINTPAWEEEHLTYLGNSQRGIPAWINRWVVEADLRIGLGMISPHLDAGFSGGAKIILPGVCGQKTVEAFHAQMAYIDGNQLGVENAPLRLDLEDFVAEKVSLDMIINVVLDYSNAIYFCVAGDPVTAHRIGAKQAFAVYGAPVVNRYPIVIANSHPYSGDFWQATKALAAAEVITEPGGIIILIAPCPEGYAEHPLFPVYSNLSRKEIQQLIESGKVEDPIAAGEAAALSQFKRDYSLFLVTDGLDHIDASQNAFVPFSSLDKALQHAIRQQKDHKRKHILGVLTHGGITAPCFKSKGLTAKT